MRIRACVAVLACALGLVWTGSALAANGLRISQVYGGGGNSGATFTHDYVELFNAGTTAVELDGMSLQYASATGTGHFGANSGQLTDLAGSIAPGGYFLVQQAGGAAGAPLPHADLTDVLSPINMSASAGKIALVSGVSSLGCNGGSAPCSAAQLARIVDVVGYGGANFYEGTGPAPGLSNTTAASRDANGCQDTDDNAADFTAGTPSPRNSSSPAWACLSDSAPGVAGTTPASGAGNVAPNTNLSVTFSEPVEVADGWFAISCAASGLHTAAVSGGPTTFTLNPDADFAAGESCTVTVYGASVTDVDADDPPDAMAADHVWSFTTLGPETQIAHIQGTAHLSPYAGQTVGRVEGIVTAKRSNGFYLQDPTPDAIDATSDAIFVFTGGAPPVQVGDFVRVSGAVSEFRPGGSTSTNLTITQISASIVAVVVLSSGNPLPAATVIGLGGRVPPATVIDDDAVGSVETSGDFQPATDGIDFYESLEAMLVQVNAAVAVGPTNRFGEIPVVGDGGALAALRTARGGLIISPADFNPERIQLDDEIVRPVPALNVGDGLSGPAIGVMDYSFGNFKLQLTAPVTRVDNGLAREVTAAPADQEIAIATFNVENLSAVDSPAKYAELAELIVHNLRAPDLIGIEEIQDNNGPINDSVTDASATWQALIAAVGAAGGPLYDYRQIDPVDDQDGGQPGGNIRVGFLFRTDRGLSFVDDDGTRPVGGPTDAVQVLATPSGPKLSHNPGRISPAHSAWNASRKPLAAEFRFRGKKLFAVVNHFSSKGGDQPLFGRFQPPTRVTETQRHQQAALVNRFVADLLAVDPNANAVVLGDINDFEFSRTVEILEGDELVNLMDTLPQAERYSYVFEGNSQVLDQILVSNRMALFPTTYDVVHVNSEFADQTSDHDPQVARVRMTGRP